jgi:hemerythrin-like metal-binding protein
MISSTRSAPPSINVRVIDDQHAVLIEKIERLEQAMAVGDDAAALSQLIRDLDDYARYHLPMEERIMKSCAYPLRDMHALEHEKCLRRLLEVERMVTEGHPAAAVEMLSRLRAWLDSHLLEWDAKLGKFLNSRGVA